MTNIAHTSSGFCLSCTKPHHLTMEKAKSAAMDLIRRLGREKRLDGHLPSEKSDPRLSTAYLFGQARGKMFGVMVCRQDDGTERILKSFSGQYNGVWEIEGWAPPLFDLRHWHRVNDGPEREIKRLGSEIDIVGPDSPRARELAHRRKRLSRELMKALHGLYTLHNFRSQARPLAEVYAGDNGIPNGTADCCGPKLLDFAARNNLHPLGMAEFYYGRPNRQGTRQHGRFYSSCREKCAPILGFLLCGLDGGDLAASPLQSGKGKRKCV